MKKPSLLKYFQKNGSTVDLDLSLFDCSEVEGGYTALTFAMSGSENIFLCEKQWTYLIEHCDLKSVTENNWNALNLICRFNHKRKFYLNQQQIDYVIRHSDLNYRDPGGWSSLFFAMRYNKEQHLNLHYSQWLYLIENSNLNVASQDNFNPFMFLLRYRIGQLIEVNDNLIDYVLRKSDLKHTNHREETTLGNYFKYQQLSDITLNTEQIDYLINNCPLNQIDNNGENILMAALSYKSTTLTPEQWSKIIDSSDLSKINHTEFNAAMLFLLNNKNSDFGLEDCQIEYILKNSDLSQKDFSGDNCFVYALTHSPRYIPYMLEIFDFKAQPQALLDTLKFLRLEDKLFSIFYSHFFDKQFLIQFIEDNAEREGFSAILHYKEVELFKETQLISKSIGCTSSIGKTSKL